MALVPDVDGNLTSPDEALELALGALLECPSMLRLAIMDQEVCIGEACLSVAYLLGLTSFSGQVELHRAGTHTAGSICVDIRLLNCDSVVSPVVGMSSPLQITPVKVHKNSLVGTLCHSESHSFNTYEVTMAGVQDHFGKEWSANYDHHHARLFANTFEGMALRGIIEKEHAMFYRVSSGHHTEFFWLTTGAHFLELLGWGAVGWRQRVYTYVLLDAGLFFSETGTSMSQDVVSKHAVHANAAPRVRCAGTFRVVVDAADESPVLVVDNDSGTYRPSGEILAKLQDFLSRQLVGLRVLALDAQAPQPDDTLALLGPDETSEGAEAVYQGRWRWQRAGLPSEEKRVDASGVKGARGGS